jgi:hypothetical protein
MGVELSHLARAAWETVALRTFNTALVPYYTAEAGSYCRSRAGVSQPETSSSPHPQAREAVSWVSLQCSCLLLYRPCIALPELFITGKKKVTRH